MKAQDLRPGDTLILDDLTEVSPSWDDKILENPSGFLNPIRRVAVTVISNTDPDNFKIDFLIPTPDGGSMIESVILFKLQTLEISRHNALWDELYDLSKKGERRHGLKRRDVLVRVLREGETIHTSISESDLRTRIP